VWKRKKRVECRHAWREVGETFVTWNAGAFVDGENHSVLYCPKCDLEKIVSKERAKIELEKVRVREEYKGREEADPCY
jgi:hypothetical protein